MNRLQKIQKTQEPMSGEFLEGNAKLWGISPAPGETDASLRSRLKDRILSMGHPEPNPGPMPRIIKNHWGKNGSS